MQRLSRIAFASVLAFSIFSTSGLMAQDPYTCEGCQHPPGVDAHASAGLGMWGVPSAPHLVIRAPIHPKPHHQKYATIPYASKERVWKQPYSYGYFGASGTRHPHRSFGHQQAFTEWRWR